MSGFFDAFFGAFSNQAYALINFTSAQLDGLPLSYAFGAGMVSSINPCGFIMLPAFAAFYFTSGHTDDAQSSARRVVRALQMGVMVTLAFVLTFGLVGVAISAGGQFVLNGVGWAGLSIGGLLIVLALYQIVARRSVFANVTSGLRIERRSSVGGLLTFGVAYAIASLGCTLPIFLTVVGGAFAGDQSYLQSVSSFVQYAAGMGFVLTVITIGIATFRQQTMRLVTGLIPYVETVGNVLLLLAGGYLIWYWTTQGSILL